MERVTSGTIELTWDPLARLALIRFEGPTHATGADAAVLIGAMSRWTSGEGKAFALLGDGSNLKGVDAEYRSAWGTFLRAHREHAAIAFFNMGPVVRIAAEMFRIGTGLKLKAFANEVEARSWLRAIGVAA